MDGGGGPGRMLTCQYGSSGQQNGGGCVHSGHSVVPIHTVYLAI